MLNTRATNSDDLVPGGADWSEDMQSVLYRRFVNGDKTKLVQIPADTYLEMGRVEVTAKEYKEKQAEEELRKECIEMGESRPVNLSSSETVSPTQDVSPPPGRW